MNTKIETYDDLYKIKSLNTRWHCNQVINDIYNHMKSLPDVCGIETINFEDSKNNEVFVKFQKCLEKYPELNEKEKLCYSIRLREIVVALKTFKLQRETFLDIENVKDVINKMYWKMKPQKIEVCEAILWYLKKVGCQSYVLYHYELFLEQVKARKHHPPKTAKNI